MEILRHAHSGLRWLVLLAVLFAIFNALGKMNGSKLFSKKDKKLGLFAMLFTHIQFLTGLVLYFTSAKVVFSSEAMQYSLLRFFLIEHMSLMLLAVTLITIGYSRAKRATSDAKRFKLTFIFFTIGLIFMLVGIPWPFQNYGAGWF